MAYFLKMIDPCTHDTTYPFSTDNGDYILPIAALFAGGECGVAEPVESESEINVTKNPTAQWTAQQLLEAFPFVIRIVKKINLYKVFGKDRL